MSLFSNVVSRVLRAVVIATLFVFAGIFVLAILCAGLVVLLLIAFSVLFTGRRPSIFTTFKNFRQAGPSCNPDRSLKPSAKAAPSQDGDSVDVESREICSTQFTTSSTQGTH